VSPPLPCPNPSPCPRPISRSAAHAGLALLLLASGCASAPAADPGPEDIVSKLPARLQELVTRSMALQSKVRRLDATIHTPASEHLAIGNPLVPQMNMLKAAFERR